MGRTFDSWIENSVYFGTVVLTFYRLSYQSDFLMKVFYLRLSVNLIYLLVTDLKIKTIRMKCFGKYC